MNRRIYLLLEVFFLVFILMDGFSLFVTVFLPIRPSAFLNIIYLDLFTSILLLFGYLIHMRGRWNYNYLKRNWNAFISITPFYFIGIILLGVNEASIILKILVLIKVLSLALSARQVGRSVDEFVSKSRLAYGFSFFILVLIFCSTSFFYIEKGVNPEVNTYEDAFWYVIQTITTVGYGDVVPDTSGGRIIGIIAMISAIGISSLLTAATTSSLIDKIRKDREKLAKQSINYVEKLENRMNDFEDKMARSEDLQEINSNIQEIKSEIENLKDIMENKK